VNSNLNKTHKKKLEFHQSREIWYLQDSNLRSCEAIELESIPFNHSGKIPYILLVVMALNYLFGLVFSQVR